AENRGVDANQSAGAIQQRPAGISRIDRRLSLDHIFDRRIDDAVHRAPERRNDAGRQALIEAKWIANGKRLLSDLKIGTFSDGDRVKLFFWRVDTNDREVIIAGDANELRGIGTVVPERDLGRVSILHDVKIGDDIAGIVPDNAGASALPNFGSRLAEIIVHFSERRDKDDRRIGLLEDGDRAFFFFREIAARR